MCVVSMVMDQGTPGLKKEEERTPNPTSPPPLRLCQMRSRRRLIPLRI